MVMEKSWNMKNWPKVMEFYEQSWKFTNLAPKLYLISKVFFAATKKLCIDVESPHFLTFSAKCHEGKIENRDGHGKLRNDHGKVMEKSWKNMLSSLWEPCKVASTHVSAIVRVEDCVCRTN